MKKMQEGMVTKPNWRLKEENDDDDDDDQKTKKNKKKQIYTINCPVAIVVHPTLNSKLKHTHGQ